MKPSQVLHRLRARFRLPGELGLVARGAGWSFVLQGAGLALGYAVHVLLARWLGAGGYGVYTYVLAWASLLAIPAGMGFPLLVVRFVPEYSTGQQWDRLRGLLQWGATRVPAVGAVLALLALAVAALFDGDSVYSRPLRIGLWLVPAQALLAVIGGMYRGFHWIGRAYAIRVLRHAVMLALLFVLWIAGLTLTSRMALGAVLAAALLVLLMMGSLLWRRVPAAIRQARAAYVPRQWLRVSIPLLLVGGFVMVLNQTDIVMIGSLLGPREAGLYQAASRTAALAGLVPIAVAAAAEPMLARLYAEGDRARLQRLASVCVQWTAGAALMAALFFIVLGRPVLAFFGEDFVASYSVLLILAGGQFFFAAFGVAAGLINLTGHQQWGMLIFGGSALLNVALNGIGILIWGYLGAALATATAFTVMGIALWIVAKKKVGIDASIIYAMRGAGEAPS